MRLRPPHSLLPTLAIVASLLAPLAAAQAAPDEMVTQIMEPTGGKILRPKDWTYAENHRGPVYMWTISRENPSGPTGYTTGVRIQVFQGVKAGAGKSAQQFVADFLDGKRKSATVISSCKPQDQGMFTRACLETEEGPHRIMYSVFWGSDQLDIAVISIAGTTKALWPTYAPIFDRMSQFEIIDMSRFQ